MKYVNKIFLCLMTAALLSSVPASALTWKEVKEFTHKHRTKILIGTGVAVTVVAVVAGVLVWKHYRGAASNVSLQPSPMLNSAETLGRSVAKPAASSNGVYGISYDTNGKPLGTAFYEPGVAIPEGVVRYTTGGEALAVFFKEIEEYSKKKT